MNTDEAVGGGVVPAKDTNVTEAPRRVRKMCAGTPVAPSHRASAMSSVLLFRKALGFSCAHDMVHFAEFTILLCVK